MSRLTTFLNGIRSMRPYAGFDWYWKLGPFIHWAEPKPIYQSGLFTNRFEYFHFEKMGIGIGPFWVGFIDTN